MKKIFFLIVAMIISSMTFAQIKGKVYDSYTNSPLIGATININGQSGIVSDKDGSFSIPCSDSVEITVSYISYQTLTRTIKNCNEELQIGLTPVSVNLNNVEVIGTRTSNINLKTPRSIGVLTRDDLTRNTGLNIQDAINLIPGVQMQTRSMFGGQRIVIRGYGADVFNSNFNGTGFKLYLNGIPITDATGLTIMTAIDNSIIGQVEVVKGPSSSIYGNGIGGVVNLTTLRPQSQTNKIVQEGIIGSYGLWRTNTRIESANNHSSIMVNYGHQNYNSYRDSSWSRRDYVTFAGTFKNSEHRSTTVYADYAHAYDQMAGEMNSADFFQKKNWTDPAYTSNNAHVEIESIRMGIGEQFQFGKGFGNSTSAFVNAYQLHQPAGNAKLSDNNVVSLGGRSVFNYSYQGKNIGLNGIAGLEFQRTIAYQKSYNSPNGVLGAINADLEIASMQTNAFTQWELRLPKSFLVVAGVGLNYLKYDITDYYNTTAGKNQGGLKGFKPVATPRFSLQKLFNEKISVYADVSQGYSPPTVSQMVIPYLGQVNKNLTPEKANQFEIGTKGSFFNQRFSYQIALFDLAISNKLVSQSVADANAGTILYTYTVNVGNQTNKGIETSFAYNIVSDGNGFVNLVRPFVTYTYSHFTYDNYKSDNNNNAKTVDYSGNHAVGVVPNTLNAGLDFRTKVGLYLHATYQYLDKMPLNFANTHYAPSYSLLNAKIGYQKILGKHYDINVYAGGNNLTNSLYYTFAFVNANPATNPASFLPGPYKATFYGGVSFGYIF